MNNLNETAKALVAPGKGLLAADESLHTADKRLTEYGIEAGPEMRRQYRNLFLAASGAEQHLSGVILFEETLGQTADDGTAFPALLKAHGIVPGIKVDKGTEAMAESQDELITNGLIGLAERLVSYRAQGARFTKWRAVIRIDGDRLPTNHALLENAKRLASYAHIAQEAGLVPILEPEVLLGGNHSRLRAKEVITETLKAVFAAVEDQAVDRTAVLVKTAMALSGSESGKKDTPEEVAESTLEALIAAVPKEVPGIVFLSGGQSADQATDNLRAIALRAKEMDAPWPLTFSYARALQGEALALWQGKSEHIAAAQEAFISRLAKVAAASEGR
ncbi:MAG: hypothetical protein B7X04_03455 [Parcubacteria group bacterium 21-54-25]|nr:MAG: hypothetical protein B7X04_03455 [Parcubacteria group bacterium 21-54-25]HQU08016.1 fructose-bisphosphate aldolase class I [Candidatus Paceibacterota bacterium]